MQCLCRDCLSPGVPPQRVTETAGSQVNEPSLWSNCVCTSTSNRSCASTNSTFQHPLATSTGYLHPTRSLGLGVDIATRAQSVGSSAEPLRQLCLAIDATGQYYIMATLSPVLLEQDGDASMVKLSGPAVANRAIANTVPRAMPQPLPHQR